MRENFRRGIRRRIDQCRFRSWVGQPLKRRLESAEICGSPGMPGGRNAIDFFTNLGSDHLRLRMIEHKRGSPRRLTGCRFIYLFEQRAKRIRIEVCSGHEPNSHQACFQFLIPAVSQKRSIDAERNTEFAQLLFPYFGCG